jgi:hypothetical protein
MSETEKPCEKCGWAAHAVHRVADVPAPIMVGWYCPSCKHFDPAVVRERQIPMKVKR